MKKSKPKSAKSWKPARIADPNRYPKGLNRRKVEAIIRHYENQTDAEAIAEAEAAYASNRVTMMAVPVELVWKVQRLITRQRRSA